MIEKYGSFKEFIENGLHITDEEIIGAESIYNILKEQLNILKGSSDNDK